jgi:hypothetical protein
MQDYANLTFNTPSMSTLITWFLNTSVNQHVTPDIASMTSSEPYTGTDQLHVGDGKGLVISHIAHSKIYAPKRTFTLSNILHIPHITKPLLSVQNFCLESNVFFEFHPFVFYVKDLISKGMLFFVKVEMVFTLCLSLLPPHCQKPSCLHIFLPLLISGIVDLGTLVRVFSVFGSNKKVSCTSKRFHFD